MHEKQVSRQRFNWAWLAPTAGLAMLLATPAIIAAHAVSPAGYKDADLVEMYADLVAGGNLENAVRHPALPSGPPDPVFLGALAWYAAGMPAGAGTLEPARLEEFVSGKVDGYMHLLKAKVERGEDNDYSRTRTWKVIQKLTMLRAEAARSGSGGYAFPAIRRQDPTQNDPWEREHTLRSPREFSEKVCGGSYERPVLVKYGNTNCTQCMLFELIGSVKELAMHPQHRNSIEVYKVWWGLRPDESFAGTIREPERLDDLAKAEGVTSSPYFIVYRNGKRYPCGDAFPSEGLDERIEACLNQSFGEAPSASACTQRVATSEDSRG